MGKLSQLEDMAVARWDFPLAYWKSNRSMIAVGGNNSQNLKQVEQYSIVQNKWSGLVDLPFAICSSSAVVLKHVLYNIGG